MADYSYRTGRLLFYVLHRVMGPDQFDRAMARYFRRYRGSGSTTEQLVEHFIGEGGPPIAAVFENWLYTTTWYGRLTAGEGLEQMIAGYRRRR